MHDPCPPACQEDISDSRAFRIAPCDLRHRRDGVACRTSVVHRHRHRAGRAAPTSPQARRVASWLALIASLVWWALDAHGSWPSSPSCRAWRSSSPPLTTPGPDVLSAAYARPEPHSPAGAIAAYGAGSTSDACRASALAFAPTARADRAGRQRVRRRSKPGGPSCCPSSATGPTTRVSRRRRRRSQRQGPECRPGCRRLAGRRPGPSTSPRPCHPSWS